MMRIVLNFGHKLTNDETEALKRRFGRGVSIRQAALALDPIVDLDHEDPEVERLLTGALKRFGAGGYRRPEEARSHLLIFPDALEASLRRGLA